MNRPNIFSPISPNCVPYNCVTLEYEQTVTKLTEQTLPVYPGHTNCAGGGQKTILYTLKMFV